jgi:starch synthase
MISMTEASDLREKLVTNRSIIQSTFCDIHHKPNTELLSELQLFLRKPIEYATTYLTFFSQFYRLLLKFSAVLRDTYVHFLLLP